MIHGSVFEVSLPSPGLTQHLPFFVSKNDIISLLIVSSTWSSVTGQMKNVCLIIMSNHTKSLPGKFQKKTTGWKKKKQNQLLHFFYGFEGACHHATSYCTFPWVFLTITVTPFIESFWGTNGLIRKQDWVTQERPGCGMTFVWWAMKEKVWEIRSGRQIEW